MEKVCTFRMSWLQLRSFCNVLRRISIHSESFLQKFNTFPIFRAKTRYFWNILDTNSILLECFGKKSIFLERFAKICGTFRTFWVRTRTFQIFLVEVRNFSRVLGQSQIHFVYFGQNFNTFQIFW